MNMPEQIDGGLLAPCGMNCLVCYRYCRRKKPCPGCRTGEENKPEHCRKCAIKDCAESKSLAGCGGCPEYPCKRLKALEKSYNTRYQASLMENSRLVRTVGLDAFLEMQRSRYTCPGCGGVISLHDRACSQCGTTYADLPAEEKGGG